MSPTEGLDRDALSLFASKGEGFGPHVPQAGRLNALKVRRVLQLLADVCGDLRGRRILDLGCAEGVYAIEAALHGAQVLAIDARTERMAAGAAIAARHGIDNVRFEQRDARSVRVESVGAFDAVLCLGILYHFDAPDVFEVLGRIRELCTRVVVIDTFVALEPDAVVEWGGSRYEGTRVREHADDDPEPVRRARLLRSIDNAWSFRFSPAALPRALHSVGFTSVLECHAPFELGKGADRVTLVATAGTPVELATYPWVNGASEAELARLLGIDSAGTDG